MMQRAVRSYGNLYEFAPGDNVADLLDNLVGPGKMVTVMPECPSDGNYTFGGDLMPPAGVAYLNCSVSEHVPSPVSSW
ncbi:MAG: hypothetical protein AAF585_21955 [Verrucomicrobiota bacterium]